MTDDAKRFRQRARDCEALARNARDSRDRQILIDIAEELNAEAKKIEAELRREGTTSDGR